MQDQLRIVMVEEGADAERLDLLTGYLSRDLRELDDVQVDRVTVEAPADTRAFDAVEIGSLLVTLLSSAALPQLINTIRGWLGRGRSTPASEPRTVRVELDGDTLVLTTASSEEQERLIQLFIARNLREPNPP
jgi:hypothetical protein